MKNKILHIVQEASYNGATIYATRLCTKLTTYAHEIVSCFNGNAFDEICLKAKCEILLNSKHVSYKYLLLKYWKFFKFIRKKKYNIIHYHQGGVGILLLAYFFRKHAIVVHHLHSGNLIGDNKKDNISVFYRTILKYLSNKTYQIAVAEHIFKEYFQTIDSIQNLKLIRNSTPYLFKQKLTKSNAVGFIGRFTKEKGFSLLPDFSVKVKEKLPGIRILIMGDEPDFFKKNFGELKTNFNLLNPSLNTEKFYNNIDLLLFLSTAKEGMPLVVLEAISFDIGIIAFPSPALKEIFGNEYPLFIDNKDEIMNILSSYYEGEIDLNKLNSIHKKVCLKLDESAMLNAIRKFYGEIQYKNFN
jgi:glycosyltransferase involved in cell wall biosynthesis